MKRWILALVLALSSLPALAQSTTVTLQVTDADAQTWNNGTWKAQLVTVPGQTPAGPPYNFTSAFGGGAVPSQNQSGALSGTGGASMTLYQSAAIVPSGTAWKFTVCPQATSPCYTQNVTIAGGSQSVTLAPPAIRLASTGVAPFAYADAEAAATPIPVGAFYYNVTSNTTRQWNGTTWNSIGGGTAVALQVNGVNTANQALLNVISGTNTTVTNVSGGVVRVDATSTGFPLTSAQVASTGGSLAQQNLGQIVGSQLWFPKPILDPVTSQQNTGGSIAQNHVLQIQLTYNSALGESLPSVLATQSSGTTCGSACQVTVTAPTLPSGFTSYNVYSCDLNAGGACIGGPPQKLASCTSITGDCVITASPTANTSSPPTTNAAWIQPPSVQANNGVAPSIPFAFFPKVDGNMYPWLGEDWESCDASSGPPLPCGTPMVTHRTYFRDNSSKTQAGKNAFVSINHDAGIGTVTTNQDRALWVFMQNPLGDVASRWGMEAIQAELDINGSPNFNGSPDSEAATASFQLSDAHTGAITYPNADGVTAIRAQSFRSGSGTWGPCTVCIMGVEALVANNNAASFSSGFMVALFAQAVDGVGCSSCNSAAIWAKPSTLRFAGSSFGVHIDDYLANANDWNIDSQANNENQGKNAFAGNTYLNHVSAGNLSGRIGMVNPTCTATGVGSGACAIRAGSSDSYGRMVLTVAGGTGAGTGTAVLNYHTAFASPVTDTSCLITPEDGSGAWATIMGIKITAHSLSSVTFTWTNGTGPTALANGTYDLNYHCWGN